MGGRILRKDSKMQNRAEHRNGSDFIESRPGRSFVDAIRQVAPHNVFAIIAICAAFAIFAVFDYAQLSRLEAEKQAMIAELESHQAIAGREARGSKGAIYSVASDSAAPASSAAEIQQAPETQLTAPNNEMLTHFMALGAVCVIVLALAWRGRRQTEVPKPQKLVETREPEGVFDAINMAVAHWAPDGRLIGCNGRFQNLFGSEAELVRANAKHSDVMHALFDGNDFNLRQDDDVRRVVDVIGADGLALNVEERPLKSGAFVTLISDNSAVKHAERALQNLRDDQVLLAQQLREEKFRAEAASRAKTSFLAHLSHDVRTPLNHIIGFADMIAHQTYGPIGDKRYLNYINDIKCSGEKLLSSFSEILELAQIEGGQLVLRRERLSIEEVLKTTASRFQDAATRARVEFELSTPQSGQLYGDRLCIERMLANLIENAIQFTPKGGSVRLAAWLADDGVVIEITDTGIGMSEERLKDLAQPFVLGDAAFTRETSGVGLGIAISRAIAELSGGALEIDSNPAVGTTVAISLPLHAAQSKSKSQIAAA